MSTFEGIPQIRCQDKGSVTRCELDQVEVQRGCLSWSRDCLYGEQLCVVMAAMESLVPRGIKCVFRSERMHIYSELSVLFGCD